METSGIRRSGTGCGDFEARFDDLSVRFMGRDGINAYEADGCGAGGVEGRSAGVVGDGNGNFDAARASTADRAARSAYERTGSAGDTKWHGTALTISPAG